MSYNDLPQSASFTLPLKVSSYITARNRSVKDFRLLDGRLTQRDGKPCISIKSDDGKYYYCDLIKERSDYRNGKKTRSSWRGKFNNGKYDLPLEVVYNNSLNAGLIKFNILVSVRDQKEIDRFENVCAPLERVRY